MSLLDLCPKEWDTDSFNRKFANSWVVHIDRKAEKIVDTFWNMGAHHPLADGTTQSTWIGKNKAQTYVDFVCPIYMRIPSGYYELQGDLGIKHALLIRKPGKQFSLGLNSKTHSLRYVKENSLLPAEVDKNLYPVLHKPLACDVEKAVEEGGPLSNTIYMTKGAVYFLDRKVGIRNSKGRIIVSNFITQEVSDVLKGTKCQITNG